MICKDYISGYCKQAIEYKKYAEIRKCNKCCIDCNNPCINICSATLEAREKRYWEVIKWGRKTEKS